jgi:hypothetical protein
MVIVALWLPLMAIFTSFAVDAGHWWDYSRNLQNRADAAALAAGDQLSVCLGSPTATDVRGIGETAQQYAGPPANTTDALTNLPYSSAQMTADGFTTSYNVPNLTAGTGPNFHLLLNSSQYWPAVAQNGVNGYGDLGSFCNAVDPNAAAGTACSDAQHACDMIDTRLTQANVPAFFNIFGFTPNITAHARVQLELVTGSGEASPVGVGDSGQSGCVVAQVFDETNQRAGANRDGVLTQWSLNQQGSSTTWTGSMPGNLNIPTSSGSPDLLALRAVIPTDCGNPFGGGDTYDAGHGITFINTYTPLNPASISAPTRGSVWLEGGNCVAPPPAPPPTPVPNDPYFFNFKSPLTCPVTVRAQVDFPNPGAGKTYGVSISEDGGPYTAMTADGTDGSGNTLWRSPYTIQPQSGRHSFALSWYLTGGTGSCTSASNGGTSGCQFDGGKPVQATFSAFVDGTAVDDSGPVIAAGVGCDPTSTCPSINGTPTSGASSGVDSIPATGTGSSPKLTATITLQGLAESGPSDKPIVLRSSVATSGRTGIFDCGQGGGNGFQNLMLGGGCGTYVTTNGTKTSGLTEYQGSLSSWANCVNLPSDPISCGSPVTGNKAGLVRDTFAQIICSGDPKCQNTPPNTACDYWQNYKSGTGPLPNPANYPDDPRVIEMAITSPQDLALPTSDPRPIRILGFATFYITGWDTDPYIPANGPTQIPGCQPLPAVGNAPTNGEDEPYPLVGQNPPNGAVWGHFIQYVFPGQGHNGQNCPQNSPLACTPALTQ